MSMGLTEVLDLARTPEERKKMKENILRLMQKRDEDIDFSDIPEVTDFSGWKRAKPYFDKIREHNLKIEAMEAEQAAKQIQS